MPVTATAQQIFAARGELPFMASLAKAAYHLVAGEPVSDATNDISPHASTQYASVASALTLLTDADLPALAPGAGTPPFTLTGIRDGMFVNENAGALIGRSSDALFVSFRGTNDNGSAGSISTDRDQWTSKGDHFALFSPLLIALDSYLAANPDVTKIYVTGHSLGAAMVQPFIDYADANYGVAVEAVTFATPGYGLGFDAESARITNYWNSYDIIRGAAWLSQVLGDQNFIVNGITDTLVSHSMDLYLTEALFMQSQGVGFSETNAPAWNGAEYDSIYFGVTVSNAELGLFSAGTASDRLTGSSLNDIMLGGAQGDTLRGGEGRDALLGGSEGDRLYGDGGRDTLIGGTGKDWLTGGERRDILTGGTSKDVFDFNAATESGRGTSARDLITDFRHASDDIDLRGIDANSRFFAFGNQAFKFIGTESFHRTEGELRYQKFNRAGTANDKTIVEGDTDGNGRADFQIELQGLITLTKGDFIL